jgi:NifB/MoaA-like Fe-S oxidoreductase
MAGEPVASVGIVPVGLTRFHAGRCRTHSVEEAQALLEQVAPWRAEHRRKLGQSFLYPSDEWYLVAGREVPRADEYDGFPQVENGVGMVRQLLDEWAALKARLPASRATRVTLVCGTLAAPVLARIAGEWKAAAAIDIQLVPVVNQFFGPVTTVSGLLTGQDIIAALRGRPPSDLVFLPKAMFTGRYGAGSARPGVTLDGLSLEDLAARIGARVEMAGTMADVLAALE